MPLQIKITNQKQITEYNTIIYISITILKYKYNHINKTITTTVTNHTNCHKNNQIYINKIINQPNSDTQP